MDAMCALSPGAQGEVMLILCCYAVVAQSQGPQHKSHVVWLTTSVLCCEQRSAVVPQSKGLQFPHLRVNSGNSCQGTTTLKSKLMSKLKAW